MRCTVEIDGKTYRVATLDVGNGPVDCVSVRVSSGPRLTRQSWTWRAVPRDGETWRRVMDRVRKERAA